MSELNDFIEQVGIRDTYRTLHQNTAEYTFILAAHGNF